MSHPVQKSRWNIADSRFIFAFVTYYFIYALPSVYLNSADLVK